MARVTIGKLQEAIQLCANGGGLCDAAMPPNESARILGAGLHNGLNRGLCPDLFHSQINIVQLKLKTMSAPEIQDESKAYCQRKQNRRHNVPTFAVWIWIDRTYIGGIERGERNVSLVNIVGIAKP